MITLPRLLNSSGNEVRRLHPMKLSISEKIIPLSTAQMTLSASETVPGRSYVELFTICGSAGIYRTKTPQTTCGNPSVSINLEHAICEVGDWIITADVDQSSKTISQALTQVFGYYRGSKWQLGTVSITGNVVFDLKYGDNILSKMNSLIAMIKDSMMTFDFSTTPWTVNVVSMGTTVSAEGRLTRNVTSASISKDDSSLCTRVYVEGLGYGGSIGYRDADTVSTYGVIEKYLSGSDYTATEAGIVADQYLAQNKNPKYTVNIGIVDLHTITGESLDEIRIGKLFRLVVPDENIIVEENIVSISWSDCVNAPNRATVTLSQDQESLVQFLQYTSSAVSSIESSVSTLKTESKRYESEIEKMDDKISLVVKEYQGENVIDAAAIVLGINEQTGSYVKIQASKIDLQGHVSISDLTEYGQDVPGYLTVPQAFCETLQASSAVWADGFMIAAGGTVPVWSIDVEEITINGTIYHICVAHDPFS